MLERTGLKAAKSKYVDAPIIAGSPVVIECELIESVETEKFTTVLARVVNMAADESVLGEDGKIDMGKKAKCSSGNFSEDKLKAIILAEINILISPDYKGILEITNKEAFGITGLEQKASALTDELSSISVEIDRLSARNARNWWANLSEELPELEDRYNEKRAECNNVVAEIDDKKTRAVIAEKFLKDLSEIKEPLKEWDDEVFRKLVDRVEIGGKSDVRMRWKITN